jgi:hypothetical protein
VGSYDPYVTYYATQVFHGFGGDAWKSFWNPRVRDLLVREQTKDDADGQAGSWAVNKQSYLGSGGRLCATSFALLTLEVYYRHPRPPEPR